MAVSAAKVSPADDRAMAKSSTKNGPPPGLSIRNGPVDGGEPMDVDSAANGTAKRKSRASIDNRVSYKDESDSDDGAPLVRFLLDPRPGIRPRLRFADLHF